MPFESEQTRRYLDGFFISASKILSFIFMCFKFIFSPPQITWIAGFISQIFFIYRFSRFSPSQFGDILPVRDKILMFRIISSDRRKHERSGIFIPFKAPQKCGKNFISMLGLGKLMKLHSGLGEIPCCKFLNSFRSIERSLRTLKCEFSKQSSNISTPYAKS
jgi:hypothetical protein